jgi:hypothetical protein
MSSIDATGASPSGIAQASSAWRSHRGHRARGSSDADGGRRPDGGGRLDQALESQGITGSALSDLRSKIEDAVKTARASADGSTDGRAAVKSAVDQVLKDAGVDVDKLHAAMRPPGKAGGDGDGDGDDGRPGGATGAQGGDSSSAAAAASLSKALQSKGIDPGQFFQSLNQAVDNSNGKDVDFSSVFAQFGMGSSVDTMA